MRRACLHAVLVVVMSAAPAAADIAAPTEHYDGGVSSSLEGIFSLEKSLSTKTSLMLWLGGGLAGAISPNTYDDFSTGIEGAVEFRFYPMSETAADVFIGLYNGIGYMHGPKAFREPYGADEYANYTIQGFGIKLGYKWIAVGSTGSRPALRLAFEPYWSIGLTYYYDSTGSKTPDYYTWNAHWLNIGLRVVLEYTLPQVWR